MKVDDLENALTEAGIIDYIKGAAKAVVDHEKRGGLTARAEEEEKSTYYKKIAKGMVKMWISYANGLKRTGILEGVSSSILSGIQLFEDEYRSANGYKIVGEDPIVLYKDGSRYYKNATGQWFRADKSKQSVPIPEKTRDDLDIAYDAASHGKFDHPETPAQDAEDTPKRQDPDTDKPEQVSKLKQEIGKWIIHITKLSPAVAARIVLQSDLKSPYDKKGLFKLFYTAVEHAATNIGSDDFANEEPTREDVHTVEMLKNAGMSADSANTMASQWDKMSSAKQQKILNALSSSAKG